MTMDLHKLALQHFSIPYLRPFQELVIQRIIEAENDTHKRSGMVVILPTGGGKSLCFMLPALLVKGLVIIIYPLLSLMADQKRRFDRAGIASVVLRGAQSEGERRTLLDQIETGSCTVVITNAETLASPTLLSFLCRFSVSLLVVDEAHTVVTWGTTFRPALSELGTLIRFISPRQLLCFTATADSSVLQGLQHTLFSPCVPSIIRASSDRPNITYHVVPTLSIEHSLFTLLSDESMRPALVFCPLRKQTEHLCSELREAFPSVESYAYHAGLSKRERLRREQWFMGSKNGILLATDAYGMGIDVREIRTVIHTYLPTDALSFLQASGRGGRDGQHCTSIVLLTYHQQRSPLFTIFTTADTCIRKELLAALDEELEHCNGCDSCLNTQQWRRDGEAALLRALLFRPLCYTSSTLATLLYQDRPFSVNSGHLSSWKYSQILGAIQILLQEGVIGTTKHGRVFLTRIGYHRLMQYLRRGNQTTKKNPSIQEVRSI
jgi:ATP-dependent DNA helicase RecQ